MRMREFSIQRSRAKEKHVSFPLFLLLRDQWFLIRDVNSVCFRSILISMPIRNNVNNLAASSVTVSFLFARSFIVDWWSFKRVCLYTFFLVDFFDDSFAFFLSQIYVTVVSRFCVGKFRSDRWTICADPSIAISQLLTSRCKRIHLWRISRLFLISPMIGLVEDSSHACKFLRLSNSRIIHLRNL